MSNASAVARNFWRWPAVTVIILSAVAGFIGTFAAGRLVSDAWNAASGTVLLTGLFVLVPFWIVALILKNLYAAYRVPYGRFRIKLWAMATALAVVLAAFVDAEVEHTELASRAGQGDDMGNLVFVFLYLGVSLAACIVLLAAGCYQLYKAKKLVG